MAQMLFAAFSDLTQADGAVQALESNGFPRHDISVVSKENKEAQTANISDSVAKGAASGAMAGGAVGGIAGLLIGAGVVPALAGLVIGGPLALAVGAAGIAASTLSGALTGAVTGTLIGALTGFGVSEEDAHYYDETINKGGVIVAVPLGEDDGTAAAILESHQASHLSSVNMPNPK